VWWAFVGKNGKWNFKRKAPWQNGQLTVDEDSHKFTACPSIHDVMRDEVIENSMQSKLKRLSLRMIF
jgi:hypothetical protein